MPGMHASLKLFWIITAVCLLAVVVVAAGEAAGGADVAGARFVVSSALEQPITKSANTTKAIRRICFVCFMTERLSWTNGKDEKAGA